MDDQFALRMESDKSFDAVVENIEKQTADHKFRVLVVHDIQATLAEKGLQRNPLKIIEVCNAKFAYEALKKEIGVALFMPCRFAVHSDGDRTIIDLARPSMIAQMLPQAGLDDLATDVEKTLVEIMKASV
ncbi:MAG: DUF302 domain-containing protein [candidate division Zixibacteria bacterium]|nr:DUF302 domain-containing protein [candidate division Zixibacteria bacterium]